MWFSGKNKNRLVAAILHRMEVAGMAKLTPKQRLFVKEYLVDLNATQAAIRAGYSAKNAGKIGPELIGKTRIKEAIQVEMDARAKRTEITADRVLKELAKIGFADIKDFLAYRTEKTVTGYDDNGHPIAEYANIVELKNSDDVDGALVSEVQVKDGQLKFKLHDKEKALELIGKHLAMFTDKQEISGKDGGPIQFERLLDEIESPD
jgi:phage terminase small subunit